MNKNELKTLEKYLENYCFQYKGCVGCPAKSMFDFIYMQGCPVFQFQMLVSKEAKDDVNERN